MISAAYWTAGLRTLPCMCRRIRIRSSEGEGRQMRQSGQIFFSGSVYSAEKCLYCKCQQMIKINTYPPLFTRPAWLRAGGPGFLNKKTLQIRSLRVNARFFPWRQQDSNLRPPARQANALPAELCLHASIIAQESA